MTSKLGNLFLVISVTVMIGLTGCTSVQDVILDSVQPEDSMMDETPVKFILLIDYPEGGKDAYIAWVESVASTLKAPEELGRIRSYDNQDQTMSPHRLVEWDFDSFLDLASYMNRPEIAEILGDIPNYSSKAFAHTFIERSDYAPTGEANWPVKGLLLVDYPLGGKQAYLDWVESNSTTLVGPPQLKAIASYDNYYGESPHRLVTFEYASEEDATTYEELEEIIAIEEELDVYAGTSVLHTFILRSDYINE